MARRPMITLKDYYAEAQIRQNGLFFIYPANSSILPDWKRFLDRHWEDETIHWEPPIMECVFQDQEAAVLTAIHNGEDRGAIPLSPILAEGIRIAIGRVPSIPDDLFQMRNLVIKPAGRYALSDHYMDFTLWQGRYVFTRDINFRNYAFYYSPGDWSAIGRMKKLKTLTIQYLAIQNFSFLMDLENLQYLDLSLTTFTQDELLAGLKNLEQLNLCGTGFTDCRVLQNLPKLKSVNLATCKLQHEESLQHLTAQIFK
ncbi:MAG: hypothetical protein HFF90_01505 [Oscillibacter sp.]|nr:hypothetical protein [Oscillibacter sp.]